MDWSYLATANAFIDGISQNAWDTGAGTGIYLTFATYMKKDSKVVSYALITPILNNMISLMMGTGFWKSEGSIRVRTVQPKSDGLSPRTGENQTTKILYENPL